jgi:hypothetical protein
LLGDQVAAAAADGAVRVVVDLAAFHVGRRFIQQRSQQPDQARFGLAAQAEQNEIVAREDGIDHLRHHGVFVAEHGGKERIAALNLADQVLAEFVFDAAAHLPGFRKGTLAQRAESARYFLGDLGQAIPPSVGDCTRDGGSFFVFGSFRQIRWFRKDRSLWSRLRSEKGTDAFR